MSLNLIIRKLTIVNNQIEIGYDICEWNKIANYFNLKIKKISNWLYYDKTTDTYYYLRSIPANDFYIIMYVKEVFRNDKKYFSKLLATYFNNNSKKFNCSISN